MGCSLLDCSKCCTIFSLSGLFFLIIIGSLLQSQPLYIRGPTNPAAAAQGCYQGAIIYLGFFIVSLAYWIFDSLKKRAVAAISGNTGSPSSRRKFGGQYGALQREEDQE